MEFNKVKYNRLYEQVLRQIEEMIRNNNLKPGDKLPPERELSEKMSVSRGILREAFRILENEGIIVTKPGGGRYIRNVYDTLYENNDNQVVSSLRTRTVMDMIEAREIIEFDVITLACQRYNEQDIIEMDGILKTIENESDPNKIQELDLRFHIAIAKATQNLVLVSIIESYYKLFQRIRNEVLYIQRNRTDMQNEHRAIFYAIRDRDLDRATAALKEHLNNIKQRFIGVISDN